MPSNNKPGAKDGIGDDFTVTTALTPAQINEENKRFWQGPAVADSSGALLGGELEVPERKTHKPTVRVKVHGGEK